MVPEMFGWMSGRFAEDVACYIFEMSAYHRVVKYEAIWREEWRSVRPHVQVLTDHQNERGRRAVPWHACVAAWAYLHLVIMTLQ